jgi:hypothetical protein
LTTLKCMVDCTVARFILKHHPDLPILKFEVNGQYSCPICFEAPSGVDNREVHVHYCCPIFFEAPSGFDILRYFIIFSVSCVRFLIHFCFRLSFRENFCYFCNFSYDFFAKSENKSSSQNFHKNTKMKIFVSTLVWR